MSVDKQKALIEQELKSYGFEGNYEEVKAVLDTGYLPETNTLDLAEIDYAVCESKGLQYEG